MKQPNRSMKPTSVNENTRRQAAPFPEYVDSFTPAHSAFGLPMYVAPLPLAPFECLPRRRAVAHFFLVRVHMKFRAGSPADAEAIAGLIASFQSELTDDPYGAGAEGYLASVSVQAEREYLASERYRYLLAYSDSELAGFIAIRDGSHLFHLFVRRSHQRQGIARRLWERAMGELCAPGSDGGFTVNSSLRAVPVYQAFGFVPAGSIQSMHGISFLPMRRPALLA